MKTLSPSLGLKLDGHPTLRQRTASVVDTEFKKGAPDFRLNSRVEYCQFGLILEDPSRRTHTTCYTDLVDVAYYPDRQVTYLWFDNDGLFMEMAYLYGRTLIPEWLALGQNTEKITDILEIGNLEIRRMAMDSRFKMTSTHVEGLTLVSESPDEMVGTLYEIPPEGERMLAVKNGSPSLDGTDRYYLMGVPAFCESPEEAQAWMAKMPVWEWMQLQRRT